MFGKFSIPDMVCRSMLDMHNGKSKRTSICVFRDVLMYMYIFTTDPDHRFSPPNGKWPKSSKFAKIVKKMGPHSFFGPPAESPGGKHLIPRTPRPHRLLVPLFFYLKKRPHTPPSWPENFFIPASQIFEKWLTNSRNQGGDQSQVLFFPSSAQQFEWRRRKKSNKQAFI